MLEAIISKKYEDAAIKSNGIVARQDMFSEY